jgi:D-alanine-D-alanine ligase-like ATP-grasp enzyme
MGFETVVSGARGIEGLRWLVQAVSPDIVFCAAHSMRGADGSLYGTHSVLDDAEVAYVGAPQAALDLALSKPAMKEAWKDASVPTPEWAVFPASGGPREFLSTQIPAPWIVKPAGEGNSRGIERSSVVRGGQKNLSDQIERIRSKGFDAIVEHYLGDAPDFMEFTVAMIGEPETACFLPVQIDLRRARGPRVVTFRDKADGVAVAVPVESLERRIALRAFARRAVMNSGLRDYARCDVVFAEGRYQALEVNGQPMIPDPWFEACGLAAGLEANDTLALIFGAALRRLRDAGRKMPPLPFLFDARMAAAASRLEMPS